MSFTQLRSNMKFENDAQLSALVNFYDRRARLSAQR